MRSGVKYKISVFWNTIVNVDSMGNHKLTMDNGFCLSSVDGYSILLKLN